MSALRPADAAIVVWGGRVLVDPADYRPLLVTGNAFAPDARIVPVFAPDSARVSVYLVEASSEDDALEALSDVQRGAQYLDVMIELGRYCADDREAVLRAIAVERWSNRYRFCAACGAPLEWTTDAVAKICTNPQRVHRHFPRVDPAVIVLVTHGDSALLGRAARWPPGFYSTLAGFVEPGETLEAALRREVAEEAGVTVGEVAYFGSESWPFPRSLMLGFRAVAQTTAIELRDGELEDARWFDPAELNELQTRMRQARPHFDTIARRMIDAWLTHVRS